MAGQTANGARRPRQFSVFAVFSCWKSRLSFFFRLRGILIFAAYPTPGRAGDGYFQRVLAIDGLLAGRTRIYVDHIFPPDDLPLWKQVEPETYVLRVNGSGCRKAVARFLVWVLAFRLRRCYFHSVLQMNLNRFGWLFHVPWLRCFFDMHGVTTEEMRDRKDYYHATLFDPWEKLAARKSALVIVVTEAMANFLRRKYRAGFKAPVLTLPIMPDLTVDDRPRPVDDGQPVPGVYAGGLDQWQLVPETLAAMAATKTRCRHYFFCPAPEQAAEAAPEGFMPGRDFELGSRSHEQIVQFLPGCVFGFVLRDENIINEVACPTKLMEYLALGVIPVLKTGRIGDFASLGLRYVTVEDFTAGRWPSQAEQEEMRRFNSRIYLKLRAVYRTGSARLLAEIG